MSGLDGSFNLVSILGGDGENERLECDNEVNLHLPFEMKGDVFASSRILNRNKDCIYRFKRDFIADTSLYIIQTIRNENVALVRAPRQFQSKLDLKYFKFPGDYHSVRHIEFEVGGFFQRTSVIYEGSTVIAFIRRKRVWFDFLNPLERFTIHINHSKDKRVALLSLVCIYAQLLAKKILAYVFISFAALFMFIIIFCPH